MFQEKPKRFEELVSTVLSLPTCKAPHNAFTVEVVQLDTYKISIRNGCVIELLHVQSTVESPLSEDNLCEIQPSKLINKQPTNN